MTDAATAHLLPDGRLHLHHGPIDLLVSVDGPAREVAFRYAAQRFETVLPDLTADLPNLTRAYRDQTPACPVSRRMIAAIAPLATDRFATPMAAVAGAVADEIIATLTELSPPKAVVNNGGDIAFILSEDQVFRTVSPHGAIEIAAESPVRGIATSGWRGRSQSLGIADAVTVLATSAARADAAATLIANAVDLPDHPAINRCAAYDVEAIPQLGNRPVTIGVSALSATDIKTALDAGASYATTLIDAGLITAALLRLQGKSRIIGSTDTATMLPADPS